MRHRFEPLLLSRPHRRRATASQSSDWAESKRAGRRGLARHRSVVSGALAQHGLVVDLLHVASGDSQRPPALVVQQAGVVELHKINPLPLPEPLPGTLPARRSVVGAASWAMIPFELLGILGRNAAVLVILVGYNPLLARVALDLKGCVEGAGGVGHAGRGRVGCGFASSFALLAHAFQRLQ